MQFSKIPDTAKIGIGWVIVITGGLYGFYLSKQQIDKTRYETMKVRERMRIANQAEYTPERNFKPIEVPVVKKTE